MQNSTNEKIEAEKYLDRSMKSLPESLRKSFERSSQKAKFSGEKPNECSNEHYEIPISHIHNMFVVNPISVTEIIDRSFRHLPKYIRKTLNLAKKKEKYTNPKTSEDIQTIMYFYLDFVLGKIPNKELFDNKVIIRLPEGLKEHINFFEKRFLAFRKGDTLYTIVESEFGDLEVINFLPASCDTVTFVGHFTPLYE